MTQPGDLTREDLIFGRALIAFQVLPRGTFDGLVAEYRAQKAQDPQATFVKHVLARGFLQPEQYKKLVQDIRRLSATAGQQAQEAAAGLPDEAPAVTVAPPSLAPPASSKPSKKLDRTAQTAPSSGSGIGGARSESDAFLRKRLKVPKDAGTFAFAGYTDLAYLGEGAVGVVYRAKANDGRTVAVKAFAAAAGGGRSELRRFLQERRVSQGLDHPGVVKVHEVGISDDVPFFCTDFIDGQQLSKLLDDRPPLEQLTPTLERLCDAVAYLHEKGIVLRDLKPDNVIVRAADGQPVIVELGLVKDVSGEGLQLTVGDAKVNTTPSYTAPEVQRNPAAATVSSDVFSLGVILYQGLTGKLPFVSKSSYELLGEMEKMKPPPPSTADAAVPVALDKVVAKALDPDPAKRPTNGRTLVVDLGEALRAPQKKKRSGTTGRGLLSRLLDKLLRRG